MFLSVQQTTWNANGFLTLLAVLQEIRLWGVLWQMRSTVPFNNVWKSWGWQRLTKGHHQLLAHLCLSCQGKIRTETKKKASIALMSCHGSSGQSKSVKDVQSLFSFWLLTSKVNFDGEVSCEVVCREQPVMLNCSLIKLLKCESFEQLLQLTLQAFLFVHMMLFCCLLSPNSVKMQQPENDMLLCLFLSGMPPCFQIPPAGMLIPATSKSCLLFLLWEHGGLLNDFTNDLTHAARRSICTQQWLEWHSDFRRLSGLCLFGGLWLVEGQGEEWLLLFI